MEIGNNDDIDFIDELDDEQQSNEQKQDPEPNNHQEPENPEPRDPDNTDTPDPEEGKEDDFLTSLLNLEELKISLRLSLQQKKVMQKKQIGIV